MTIPSDVDAIIAGAKWKPNSEPQRKAIASRADSVLYGGAAGGGKTDALKAKAARHIGVRGYAALLFRQTSKQVRQPGGLWDTCRDLYSACGGVPNETELVWKFHGPSSISFGYIEHDRDLANWKGAQCALIGFDQLEEFTWRQYTYMQSRNRSTCGVSPRMFSTCNPDPDSFLRQFVDWWIDADGYAIEARSGVVRYYVIDDDSPVWGDPDKLARHYDADSIQSFTFIPARLSDNTDLMRQDPRYMARLKGLPRVERERLLYGNWNVRWSAGDYFKREQFQIADAAPPLDEEWRYWDRAATIGSRSWTVGVRMGRDAQGRFWITDVVRFQAIAQDVQQRIANVTNQDGYYVNVGIEGDPGQAGKSEAEAYVRDLAGFNVEVNTVRESKGARARPLSAQVAIGNVYLVRAPWNDEYLREMANFDGSDKCQADQVDASSGAFHMLTAGEGDPGISFVDARNGNGNGHGESIKIVPAEVTAEKVRQGLERRLMSRFTGSNG